MGSLSVTNDSNISCIETMGGSFWALAISNGLFTAYSTYLFTNNNAFNDRRVYTNALLGWSSSVQLLTYSAAVMHDCDTQYHITTAYHSGTIGILIGDLISALTHKDQAWHEQIGLALLVSLGVDRVNGVVAEFLSDVTKSYYENALSGKLLPEPQQDL